MWLTVLSLYIREPAKGDTRRLPKANVKYDEGDATRVMLVAVLIHLPHLYGVTVRFKEIETNR